VKDIRGEEHLCFFLHRVVERLDRSGFEQDYGEEGPPASAPALRVKVWLYAYALGVTWSRRLEERVREDLAFRYLAGGASPDPWTLNEFRRQHRRAIYERRKAIIEPVFGVLKEQRGMRRFRCRGLAHVGIEMALAATAYNLTRRWSYQRAMA
jgi:transposase